MTMCFIFTLEASTFGQVGYDPNNLYSAGNKPLTPGDDKGEKDGWHNNPNNPHHLSNNPNIPIDDHIWILMAGGGGLCWYHRRKHKKQMA